MEAGRILEGLPRFNFLQISVFLTVGYLCFRAPWQLFGISFMATKPSNFSCRIPANQSEEYISEQCSLVNIQTNQSSSCSQWDYFDVTEKQSIVAEWDLVCSSDYLVNLEQTVYVIGQGVGALFLTPLADRFGRRTLLLVSMLVHCLLAICLMFSIDIFMFMPIRFFMGCANQVIQTASFVLMAEYASVKYRTLMTNSIMIFWAAGIVAMAGIAFLLRNWRGLVLVYSVAPNLLLFVFYFTLPESVFFLVAKKRYGEVEKTLMKVASKRIPVVQNSVKMIESEIEADTGNTGVEHRTTKQAIKDIVRSPKMLLQTFGLFWLSISLNMTYYITTMMTGTLSGDVYVNYALSGLVEMPFIIAAMVLCVFVPRTILLSSLYILGFTALMAYSFTGETVIAYFGRGAISGSYIVQIVYVIELYPTAVRSEGLGFYQVGENFGPMIANPIRELPWSSSGATSFYFFLSILTLLNVIVVSLMPETKGYVLPNTVKEIESRHSFSLWRYLLCLQRNEVVKTQPINDDNFNNTQIPLETYSL